MTSFVHVEMPTEHPGVARFERAAGNLRTAANRFDSAKGLAAFLLAAVVSAMLVVADQVMSTWADGHLMAAWVVMWAIAFSVLAMFAGTARRFSRNVIALGNEWAAASAHRRADARLWAVASSDPRVMADLQAAMLRSEAASEALSPAATPAPVAKTGLPAVDADEALADNDWRRVAEMHLPPHKRDMLSM